MSDEEKTDEPPIAVDKVRASTAGHAYHEAVHQDKVAGNFQQVSLREGAAAQD